MNKKVENEYYLKEPASSKIQAFQNNPVNYYCSSDGQNQIQVFHKNHGSFDVLHNCLTGYFKKLQTKQKDKFQKLKNTNSSLFAQKQPHITRRKLTLTRLSPILGMIFLLLTVDQANAGCNSLCDNNYNTLKTTTSCTSTTAVTFDTASITVGHLDTPVAKPSSGSYCFRNWCDASNWGNCGTLSISMSPAACHSFLFWDSGGATSLATPKSFPSNGNTPIQIYAIVPYGTPLSNNNNCVLSVSTTAPSSTGSLSFTFSVNIVACNAGPIVWDPNTSFTIGAQSYNVGDPALLITASAAIETKACGYPVSYQLLLSPNTALTAAQAAVFSIVSGSPNSIRVQTTDCTMFGTYNLVYRAKITNERTGADIVKDAPFTVTIVSCCAFTVFDPLPFVALNTMTTTALATPAQTQVLQIKDSVSKVNGNNDGWTYCQNRQFTIFSGMGSQSFLSVTSNSLSSTITLLSNQLSDQTACSPTCPAYTIQIKVCLVNFPSVCTTSHPQLTVNIGVCVVTSYTVAAYADKSYTIGSTALNAPYPTFTQTPACAQDSSHQITVNTAAFPGTNLNGGGSMASVFTDDTTNSRIVVYDTDMTDGTNVYNIVFSRTLNIQTTITTSVSFKITLVNPCLTATVQDSGQIIALTGTELQATATPFPPLIVTQFKNSVSGTSVDPTTGCGPYTYSLQSYTGTFLIFDAATPELSVKSLLNTDNSASPYTIGLKGCLTNYAASTCFTKSFTVTIGDCIISTYDMTLGDTDLSTSPQTYQIGDTALIVNLPTFTQTPLCGYVETKSCFLSASPTACPSWVTATQTTWTIHCTSPTTCPAGNYNLVLQAKLNNSPNSIVTQTLVVTIVDPCPSAAFNTIQAGTVNTMITSSLKTPGTTQVLSYWNNTASLNAGVLTMCGGSTFSLVAGTYSSYLSLSGTTLTLLSTSLTDRGIYYPQIKQCLSTPAYNDVCTTVSFTVQIAGCALTSFTAPTIAAKSSTIYTGATLTIPIPAYTQTPNCAHPVSYSSKIKKTANANANRPSYFADTTTSYPITGAGVLTSLQQLSFIYYNQFTKSFTVYSDDLNDGGTYTIVVTATVTEDIPQALDVNSNLNFQLTLSDPCSATVINNFASPYTALNVVSQTITTSVKYSGFVAPFNYLDVSYQFHTYMDKVSFDYGQYADLNGPGYTGTNGLNSYEQPYTNTTDNLASIYCGPRTYTFGGAASTMPAWLKFNSTTGNISVQTADDAMVKLAPGYSVTLKACLEYYPTICSTAVTFYVIIQECQIVNFVQDATQPDLAQSIFDVAVSQPIVTFTQTPLCGWILTYTAQIVAIDAGYTGTATVGQSVVTNNPAWATFDTTPTAPQWIVKSTDFKDATVFTIRQRVTLNNKLNGVAQNTFLQQLFTVTFIDPCWQSSFVLQSGIGETFDSASTAPLIRTSVKLGTDNGASGTPATFTFDFHHDTTSDRLPVGTPDSSNWVCGPRKHQLSILNPVLGGTTFITIVDSEFVSTLTKPVLSVMTSSDFDIGTWQIELTVSLTRYPSVTETEYFYVQIDQCLLNLLTEDSANQIRTTQANPFVFQLYAKYAQQKVLPTYTQQPACGYPLSYTLTQIQTWNNATQSYDSTPIQCPFANLDNEAAPTTIDFYSDDWSVDQCLYPTSDPRTCDLANAHPYQLQLTAFVDPALIQQGITFQTTSNTDEKFYVLPQDPCHSATLTASLVPSKIYFLGDSAQKLGVATSPDSVSSDTLQNIVDGSGIDKCGPRTYQLFTYAMATPPFATVPLQQDPPIISIYTSNAAMVGVQQLIFVSGLANYTHISVNTTFTITIYNLKIGKAIPLQYYQITKAVLTLTWAPFILSPAPPVGTMAIYYTPVDVYSKKTGELVIPPPTWLTVDLVARSLKIYTNAFGDQGVYDIVIYGSITGFTYKRNQTITVNVTKTPPPQLSTTPPNFTQPLVNQEFKMGEALTWTLPNTYSVGSFAVKASMTQGPKWLSFEPKTLTFTVKQGSTKLVDTGDVTVQITLQDTTGAKGTYSFKITCIAPPVVVPPVFNSAAPVAYPIPKITKITNKGQVTVVWDQQMRIPRNLTQVSSGFCNYVNPTTYEIERQPNLEVYVMRGNGNEGKNLTFTWNITSWEAKTMIIQLYFAIPEDVSYGVDQEKLRLTFFGMTQFVSQNGIPVNGGRDPNKNSIPIFKIPPQVAINTVPVVRRNNKAGMTTGQIGPMVFQLGISSLLNSVWAMVDTQQIIILLPLFDIVIPENAAAFFAQLMTIAAFAIIPTDPIFGYIFDAPPANLPLPLSDNFMAVGFATTYITNNLGTLFFSLMYFPIMSCVYLLIKRIPTPWIMKYRIGLGRSLFWSNTFNMYSDQYTIISTCALIQLAYLDWSTNYGTRFCSFLGCLYTGVSVALPFVVVAVCLKNYDLIKSGDKVFKQRFYSMWKGLRTDDKGFIVYHWYFLVRRFMIGALCVFSRKILFFQISGLVFNIIFGTIIAGQTLCMEDKRLNTIEYFNETMIMMVMYCLICFTDFLPDKDMKSQIGIVCISFVISHILINLSFLFGDYAQQLKLRYKRWAMFRKYAKMRAIKNYKYQKQIRHERFTKRIKNNEQVEETRLKKMLQPIQEESKEDKSEESSRNNQRSYDYANEQNDDHASNQDSNFEKSEQDLNYGDHFNISKKISRQPAEAPEIQIVRMKEFSDAATTSDFAQNQKLALTKPVEFPIDMEKKAQKNLIRRIPHDSIYPDLQAIMKEAGLDDEDEQLNVAQKLKRGVFEQPLQLLQDQPQRLVHNKLARMVQQDVTLPSSKVVPEDILSRGFQLRIAPDTEAIHSKLFKQMEAGDAPQLSGTEQFKKSRNDLMKRKIIVPDEIESAYQVSKTSQMYSNIEKRKIEVHQLIDSNQPHIQEFIAQQEVQIGVQNQAANQKESQKNQSAQKINDNEIEKILSEFAEEQETLKPQSTKKVMNESLNQNYYNQLAISKHLRRNSQNRISRAQLQSPHSGKQSQELQKQLFANSDNQISFEKAQKIASQQLSEHQIDQLIEELSNEK